MARVDPFKNYNYIVEINGIQQAGFSECSGFGSSVEVVEYREGGDSNTVRKTRGKASFSDITLKWGLTTNRDLYDWHLHALNGTVPIDRRHGSVVVRDDQGTEQVRWNFFDAWPSKWEGPSLNATANEVAVDTLTLCCERLERA